MRRLTRNLLAPLAFLAVAGAASAQCAGTNTFDALPDADRNAMIEAARQDPYGQGLLWRAEKDGRVINLVGTFHMSDARHDQTMAAVAPLLDASDAVFVEVTAEAEAAFQTLLGTRTDLTFITEGPSMIDRLGEERWAVVADHLRARGMPPFMGAKMQPWFLGMMLSVPPCAMAQMQDESSVLDKRIATAALDRGLPLSSLDDPDTILALLSGDPIDQQIADLELGLELVPTGQAGADGMVTSTALYFREEPRLFWEFAKQDVLSRADTPEKRAQLEESFAKMEQALLDTRNRDWIGPILAAPEQRLTVAVGAAHLIGDAGLPALLAAEGYILTRLPR